MLDFWVLIEQDQQDAAGAVFQLDFSQLDRAVEFFFDRHRHQIGGDAGEGFNPANAWDIGF